MPHELFLTTKQTTKGGNVFANNVSADIKISKAQISKITQSRGSCGSWLGIQERQHLQILQFI